MSKVTDALRLTEGANWADRVLAAAPGSVSQADAAAQERAGTERPSWDVAAVRRVAAADGTLDALFLSSNGTAYAGEQYRLARTRIAQRLGKPFVLVVSSPGVGDGKTLTAQNLAVALALKGQERTLLLDGDLRKGAVHQRLRISSRPGLAEVLSGDCRLEQALLRFEKPAQLYVLPAGEPKSNPSELLSSSVWQDLAKTLRCYFDYVIVDSPPVSVLADFDLIAAACDGVVLVVRPNHTDRSLCSAALHKVRSKLTGVLINAAEEWILWKRGPRRYYDYYRRRQANDDAG